MVILGGWVLFMSEVSLGTCADSRWGGRLLMSEVPLSGVGGRRAPILSMVVVVLLLNMCVGCSWACG